MPFTVWSDDLKSWWCVYGYRGGDSVLGVGARSAQIRNEAVHVTFAVGSGHECGVRTGTMYPLRRAALDRGCVKTGKELASKKIDLSE